MTTDPYQRTTQVSSNTARVTMSECLKLLRKDVLSKSVDVSELMQSPIYIKIN